MLLDTILAHQQRSDCLSPKECRPWLGDQLTTQTRTVVIDRFCWHRFLPRTPELGIRRCDYPDVARALVKRADLEPYAFTDTLGNGFECGNCLSTSGGRLREKRGSPKEKAKLKIGFID
jgi:hypothetical protein